MRFGGMVAVHYFAGCFALFVGFGCRRFCPDRSLANPVDLFSHFAGFNLILTSNGDSDPTLTLILMLKVGITLCFDVNNGRSSPRR